MDEHGYFSQVTEAREWVSTVTCQCGERLTGHGRQHNDAIAAARRAMLAHLAAHPGPAKK